MVNRDGTVDPEQLDNEVAEDNDNDAPVVDANIVAAPVNNDEADIAINDLLHDQPDQENLGRLHQRMMLNQYQAMNDAIMNGKVKLKEKEEKKKKAWKSDAFGDLLEDHGVTKFKLEDFAVEYIQENHGGIREYLANKISSSDKYVKRGEALTSAKINLRMLGVSVSVITSDFAILYFPKVFHFWHLTSALTSHNIYI